MVLSKRTIAVVGAALLALGVFAPSASAAEKPHGTPYVLHFAAGAACAFPVQISGLDGTTLVTEADGSIVTFGYFDATVTNLRNGEKVFRVADGPGTFSPDGTTTYARGRWVDIIAPRPGHPARTVFVTGSKFWINQATGALSHLAPDVHVLNLCELID